MQKSATSAASGGIPRGVGAPPPPGMDPRHGRGKLMCIKVRMLDDCVAVFHLGHKATGQALFDEVCRHLNLLESDYFGLEYIDGYGNRCWLEKDKSILRQITSAQSDARFYFVCKFYTPNPTEIEEEYTRYLLGLQLRRDLANGELLCSENTAALLVSFIVQAECGDFSADDYPDHTYLSVTNFVPNQTAAFQQKVMDNHKKLIGMSPGEADLALLETARRCDFYGIKLHSAKDIEGTDVALSVAHMGIKVFHQLNCISTFSWAKIRKLSFKRKRLMIKLHPESYQYYKETIEFNFENRNECKNFWKKCVEHHAFFRCFEAPSYEFSAAGVSNAAASSMAPSSSIALSAPAKKDTRRLFSHGSSFRYQGRTQKQLIDFVREHRKRREPFQRPLRSNRNNADPYGTLRNSTAQRRIQFNVMDPMHTSTVSASGGDGRSGGGSGGGTGFTTLESYSTLMLQSGKSLSATERMCGGDYKGRPAEIIHQQQQYYFHPHHHPHSHANLNAYPLAVSGAKSEAELSAHRYPDVYYPSGVTKAAQQQQQPQLQPQQLSNLNPQQFYHFHHYGDPQQQIYYSQNESQQAPYQQRNCCYQPQAISQSQAQRQKYGDNAMSEYGVQPQKRSQPQRPKSVYDAVTSTGDASAAVATKSATRPDYGVGAQKNHHSSGDVTSICGMTSSVSNQPPTVMNSKHRTRQLRRDDSFPPTVAEGNEETPEDFSSKNQRESSYENNYHSQATQDQMSTSLPNVLADDLKTLCQGYCSNNDGATTTAAEHFTNPPPKSMSGENFIDDDFESTATSYADFSNTAGGSSAGGSGGANSKNSTRQFGHQNYHQQRLQQRGAVADYIYDNMSEGSYRLGENADGGNSSSTSDVGADSSLSSRALSTTFTTKRVGNVIVKRVIDSNNLPRQKLSHDSSSDKKTNDFANDDEDDDDAQSSYSANFCKVSSVSAPASSRNHFEQQKPLRQRVVPSVPMAAYDASSSDRYNFYRPTPPRLVHTVDAVPNNDIIIKTYTIEGNIGRDPTITKGILKSNNYTDAKRKVIVTDNVVESRHDPYRPTIVDNNENNNNYFYGRLTSNTVDSAEIPNSSILMRSRPVLVTPISLRNPASFSANSASSSTFSTPQPSLKNFATTTASTFIQQQQEHQIPIVTPGHSVSNSGKPVIQGAKYTKLSIAKNETTTSETENSTREANKDASILDENQNQQQQSKGIPGRVITKQNMVITPEGILPKEEITGQKREKPKVPPKPKEIAKKSSNDETANGDAQIQVNNATENSSTTVDDNKLLEPLNAILDEQATAASLFNDKNNNKDIDNKESDLSVAKQQEQKLYDQIRVSVQSEDEPDVRRLQTFGSGAQIPYTLTMRNVETPKSDENAANHDAFQLLSKGKRQKSLDLINRKQLPSQNSFSSQDHSISPTSADSGNVVEYIMRRRSVSSDRCQTGEGSNAKQSLMAQLERKDRRRKTQPVSLSDISKGTSTKNLGERKPEALAPKASMEEDLPEPPPPSMLSKQTEKEKKSDDDETQRLAKKIVSGILETDF